MPQFEFSLSRPTELGRLAGMVTSASFSDALDAIAEQTDAVEGDTLEIGVQGFPPARFELVISSPDGAFTWRPTMNMKKAA